jgi:hypothetical protein
VIGFYEHTFMRVKGELDLKEMAELFTKFFESPAVGQSLRSETQQFKTMVYENLIPLAIKTEVLDYERASEVIRQSGGEPLVFARAGIMPVIWDRRLKYRMCPWRLA